MSTEGRKTKGEASSSSWACQQKRKLATISGEHGGNRLALATVGGRDKEFWSFKVGRFSQHEANRYGEVRLEVKRLEGKSDGCEEGKMQETILEEHILAVVGEVGRKDPLGLFKNVFY